MALSVETFIKEIESMSVLELNGLSPAIRKSHPSGRTRAQASINIGRPLIG